MSDYDPIAHGAQCHRCPLANRRVVPPTPAAGGKPPKLIIVGMNPGRHEENKGMSFVGPSGRLLDGCLRESGFDRAEGHITNAALCRNDTDAELKAAIPCCAPRLARELAALLPSTPILALGAEATRVVLGKAGIMKARGFIWTTPPIKDSQLRSADRRIEKMRLAKKTALSTKVLTSALDSAALIHARRLLQGRTVIPSVHPAFILRGADGWNPIIRIDIKRAVRWATKPFPLEDSGPYKTATTAKEAKALLEKMGKTVIVDIETDGANPMEAKMTCVGVADAGNPRRIAILDPWKRAFGPVLAKALKDRTVITHNGPQFDELVLRRYGITYSKREDTLVAHHAFASHLPKSLAHVGSVYCAVGPWKQKFKQGSEEKGIAGFGVKAEDLAQYNAIDVRVTALSWKRMQPDLAPERKVYELDMKMAGLYQRMQITGILVDQKRRRELSRKMKFRAAGLLGEMRTLLNRRSFHPRRIADIRKALFVQLKAPTYLAPMTPTGLHAANAVVLEALKTGSNRAAKLADLIVRWRSANDVRSEYLDNVVAGADGRVHAGWRLGPVTGRPACRDPNLLNTPTISYCKGCGEALIDGMTHKEKCKKREEPQPETQIRDIYIAKEGYTFVYFDTSQVEMRFSAAVSGDEAFMKACGADVHVGNALVVFADIPGATEALTNDPKGAGKKFRDISKNIGFAISYLAEADALLAHLMGTGFDVDMATCQAIIDKIRSTYWRYFQFVEENVALCRKQGFLRTPFLGRKRWMGFFPRPTECANLPIQGGVADIMSLRLLEIDGRKPKGVEQIAYAYDSGTYEVPEGLVDRMKGLIRDVWSKEIFVPRTGKTFLQPIDLKVGHRLSDFG
jgi:uracil-DNA glycosylase family 4